MTRSGAALPPADLLEVADGVFAFTQPDGGWWVNSAGFVVGPDGVVAVDACASRARTEQLLAAIRRVTPLPVRTLVNTHSHGDHTYGNGLFEHATVLAHVNCRSEMRADRLLEDAPRIFSPVPDWGGLTMRLPDVTFDHGVDLWCGDRRLRVEHVGRPAHTTGDSVVRVSDCEVLFTGDLVFNGGAPLLMFGSVTGYLEVVTALRGLPPATVLLPGHGAPCGPQVLDVLEAYTRFVLDVAREAVAEGHPPLVAARAADLGELAGLAEPERLVLNLHRAFVDLGAREVVDVGAAFADAVAYAGGPLRTAL